MEFGFWDCADRREHRRAAQSRGQPAYGSLFKHDRGAAPGHAVFGIKPRLHEPKAGAPESASLGSGRLAPIGSSQRHVHFRRPLQRRRPQPARR